MEDRFTYLLINLGSVIVPFIFSFHPKLKFSEQHVAFLKATIIVALVFIGWDVFFTYLGVWAFNERYITGFYFLNLPLEEILFFICIPYASVFTYHCFRIFFKPAHSLFVSSVSVLLITGLAVGALFNYQKLYTVTTFCVLAALIWYSQFIARVQWLSTFYLMFAVILVPFFIVNGLLTGTGLDEPVVIYDNKENLEIRMLTIPFEDVFYGMSLLLLNTSLYERFKK